MLYGSGGGAGSKPGTANRPPAWRRTKQEVVDDKIERMLETYKLMDEMSVKRQAAGHEHHHKRLAEKYFGDDDGFSSDNTSPKRRDRRVQDSDDEMIQEDNEGSELTIPVRSR